MKIRFMSDNKHKIAEVQRILTPVGVEIVPIPRKIEELQTQDVHALVRDKLIKAFQEIGRPLFVEHTALYLGGLNVSDPPTTSSHRASERGSYVSM